MSSIVVRGCSGLVLGALLAAAAAAGPEDESWAGKKIILTQDGVRIVQSDDRGVMTPVGDANDMVYRVIRDKDGWLRVRVRSVEGWFLKDRAVLLDNAVPYFSERLRANPRDALAFAHRGRAWRDRGDLDRALKDFDEAIRLAAEADFMPRRPIVSRFFGEAQPAPQPQRPTWFRQRGLVYDEKGDYDKALRDFTEALRLNPQDPLSYVERGITYKRKKEYDKAAADLSEAIRLDPGWANAYFNRGNTYKARKEFDRAIADFSEAIRLDPKDPDAYFNRANAYRARKDYTKAAADLAEVVRLDPQDPDAHEALAWLLATCPDGKVRDGERAVQSAGRACELTDGKSAYCLATLAAAFAELGKFDLAVKWQQRALESPKFDKDEGPQARARLQLFQDRKAYREE